MSRARLLSLFLILAIPASSQDFRFIRPVHVVQNNRAGKKRGPLPPGTAPTAVVDPPEVTIGERLFMETRFSQFFAAHYDGDVNHPLPAGDPVLKTVAIRGKEIPGPFAVRSINCRSCHFVAEFAYQGIDFNRTYADFAQRSPVPQRDDGRLTTTRNSMSMVDSFITRNGDLLLHSDGEFASSIALVKSTLTGRNFGWLPSEHDKAIAHIAKVIREDAGADIIDRRYGGSYARVLAGTDPTLHPMFRLPRQYTIDVSTATDQQIFDAVAKLIAVYLESLTFSRDNNGVHDGSPYDMFLKLNKLPAAPNPGESDAQYSARLARAVEDLKDPRFVDEDKVLNWFQYHRQKFNFGPEELAGLRIFLRTQSATAPGEHTANCTACHIPPDFTDRSFHNNGASQEEYDSVHGEGAFDRLAVPSYAERSRHPDRYLPATPQHPNATEIFRSVPTAANPRAADLGMWNIFANFDYPEPQPALRRLLCPGQSACDPRQVLPRTIGLFRTPSLRDLEDSQPFMHTGRFLTIEDVLHYYIRTSDLARRGALRNAAPELKGITIDEQDIVPLAAFLRSLNEDYD